MASTGPDNHMASTGPDMRRRIAQVVQDHITRTGSNVARFSIDTGIPRTTLQRKLAGARSFDVDELATIADHFDLDVLDILAAAKELAVAS